MQDEKIRESLNAHWQASATGDLDAEHDIYDDDAICDYPQSGERIIGRINLQALRGHHPGKPSGFDVRRIQGEGSLWVTESGRGRLRIPSSCRLPRESARLQHRYCLPGRSSVAGLCSPPPKPRPARERISMSRRFRQTHSTRSTGLRRGSGSTKWSRRAALGLFRDVRNRQMSTLSGGTPCRTKQSVRR